MQVAIHLGLHKTGTTSIQNFLKRNQAVLKDRGVLHQTEEQWPLNHSRLAISLNKEHPGYNPTFAAARVEG